MQKWLLKAFIQKVISYLPQAHKLNYQVQRFTTLRHGMSDQFFLNRLQHFTRHYQYFNKYRSESSENYSLLELGTGWHPIVPLAFYLSGANNILTIDIRKLISVHSLTQTIQKFECLFNRGELVKYIPDLNPCRMQKLVDILHNPIKDDAYSLLKYLQITAIEHDACSLNLGNESLDLIISNNVLQDIPPFILEKIFNEFARVLKKEGVLSHVVDFSDQYANFDEHISPLNYLQYSERQWHLVTNSLVRQNRQRIPFYRQLFSKTNLTVLEEINSIGPRKVLDTVELHPTFKDIPEEDLLVLQSQFVGSKELIKPKVITKIVEETTANVI